MWSLIILSLSGAGINPYQQGGFATPAACIAAFEPAKQSLPIVGVQQAYCMSTADGTTQWIVKDGKAVTGQ